MDLLDFYRGTLSARRLGVLVRQLPVESATVRAMNGGRAPWGQLEHLVADLWTLTLRGQGGPHARWRDHPTRAEMEAKTKAALKQARVIDLRAKFEQRKRTYGLG